MTRSGSSFLVSGHPFKTSSLSTCIVSSDCVASSNIGTDRPGFLGRRKGTAGRRKPPQGAALISMREHRARIGRTVLRMYRDVGRATYPIAAL